MLHSAFLCCCVVIAVTGIPDTVWTWVNRDTALFALVVMTLFIIALDTICYKQTVTRVTYLLSSDGNIREISADAVASQSALQQLHPTSMMLPWGLCLQVVTAKRYWFQTNHTHLGWVLRNECSEQDYRRLCRAVVVVRKEMYSRKN